MKEIEEKIDKKLNNLEISLKQSLLGDIMCNVKKQERQINTTNNNDVETKKPNNQVQSKADFRAIMTKAGNAELSEVQERQARQLNAIRDEVYEFKRDKAEEEQSAKRSI